MNLMQDGDETDVDCGGDDCAPCDNGFDCQGNDDCLSFYCANNNVCTACDNDNDCDEDRWCDESNGQADPGLCLPDLPEGATCDRDEQCETNDCDNSDNECVD